jgi:hypothetical protein
MASFGRMTNKFERHLKQCTSCQAECEQIKFGMAMRDHLQSVEAPAARLAAAHSGDAQDSGDAGPLLVLGRARSPARPFAEPTLWSGTMAECARFGHCGFWASTGS